MNNKVYNVLKILAQILIPFSAMIVSILGALGLGQYCEIITAITLAVNTFIGVLLKISSDKYWTENTITTLNQDEDSTAG